MVTLSPVSTPTTNVSQNRDTNPVRDETSVRDRLATTRPAGGSLSKTDSNSQKNYRQQTQDFSEAKLPDPSAAQGNRRGSLLDLTV